MTGLGQGLALMGVPGLGTHEIETERRDKVGPDRSGVHGVVTLIQFFRSSRTRAADSV